MNEAAVTKIYQMKHRILNKPVLILVDDVAMLSEMVDNIPESAQQLIKQFWPGPITILFKMKKKFLQTTGKYLHVKSKVGIRISSNAIATSIVHHFGHPIVSTSANISHKHGSHSIAAIKQQFSTTLDLLIDQGDLLPSLPSTIVDPYSTPIKIIRQGAIPESKILSLKGESHE